MDDDGETHKLILRLQKEDLAAIWASSTTPTDDTAALDADVSLRLYRQEFRTAEQQIEDERSAQAAAQNEVRQRDAILADREAARRLFLELNPNEPLPESNDGQSTTTEPSTHGHTLPKTEVPPAPESSHLSGTPGVRSLSSLFTQRTTPLVTGVKRSNNHLETIEGPPPKRQAVEDTSPTTNSDRPAQTFVFTTSAPASRKRPGQDNDDSALPAKKYHSSSEPKSHAFAFGTTQSAADTQPTSAVSDPVVSPWEIAASDSAGGKSPVVTTEPLRFGQPATSRLTSTPRPVLPPRTNGRDKRTANTTESETELQELPASRQPIAPGQQLVDEEVESEQVECVACCKEVARTKSYNNSCSHSYCSKCINRLFKKAVRDDSLWPPQCCKAEMAIEDIERFLPDDLVPLVKTKQVEMSVPILDRVYCATCSAFIPQEQIHETEATCHGCRSSTCTVCKKSYHVGICQTELEHGTQDLEALAETQGWKKCSTCLLFVEHRSGCAHMT